MLKEIVVRFLGIGIRFRVVRGLCGRYVVGSGAGNVNSINEEPLTFRCFHFYPIFTILSGLFLLCRTLGRKKEVWEGIGFGPISLYKNRHCPSASNSPKDLIDLLQKRKDLALGRPE